MASVTRTQFDPTRGVVKKIFQKGRYVLDADLNEQSDILVDVDRLNLSSLLQDANIRFGDGFKVEGTGATQQVTIRAGRAAFQITSERAIILDLASDYNLTGFTAHSGDRVDYVYLDILVDEIDSSEDSSLVNPNVGQETCVDERISYTFAISESGPPGAAPNGHVYVNLATVNIVDNAYIADDVVSLLNDYWNPEPIDFSGRNFVENGDFRVWTSGQNPTGWTKGSAGGVHTQSVLYTGAGLYSAKATGGGLAGNNESIYTVPEWKALRGRSIVVRFKATLDATIVGAASAALTIDYGTGTLTLGSVEFDATPGTMVELVGTMNIPSSATKVQIKITTSATATPFEYYISEVAMFVGDNHNRQFEPSIGAELDKAQSDVLNRIVRGIEIPYYAVASVAFNNSPTVATPLTDNAMRMSIDAGGAPPFAGDVVRIPYYHRSNVTKLVLYFEGTSDATGNANVYLATSVNNSPYGAINDGGWTYHRLELDTTTGYTEGQYYELQVKILADVTNILSHIRKVAIHIVIE